jgi:hypothetical protein
VSFYTTIATGAKGAAVTSIGGLPVGKYLAWVTGEANSFLNITAFLDQCKFSPTGTGYAPTSLTVPGTGETFAANAGIVLSSVGSITFSCDVSGPAGNNGVILRGAMSLVRVGTLNGS